MLKLYGFTTSPCIRRWRIWLANTKHEFINLPIFAEQDWQILAAQNPTMKIPMLEDEIAGNQQVIVDTRVIYPYLTDKLNDPLLT
jgi:glutathione S-transferase